MNFFLNERKIVDLPVPFTILIGVPAAPDDYYGDGDGRRPFTQRNATTANITQKWLTLGSFINLMNRISHLFVEVIVQMKLVGQQ